MKLKGKKMREIATVNIQGSVILLYFLCKLIALIKTRRERERSPEIGTDKLCKYAHLATFS